MAYISMSKSSRMIHPYRMPRCIVNKNSTKIAGSEVLAMVPRSCAKVIKVCNSSR